MSTTAKKTVGVIGGSGYTGGELLRLLVNHPLVTIDFVYSSTRPGTLLTETHTDLIGQTICSLRMKSIQTWMSCSCVWAWTVGNFLTRKPDERQHQNY